MFMKAAAATVTGANLSLLSTDSAEAKMSASKSIPKRPYGKTGEYISVIGLGGMVLKDAVQDHANMVVREAVEAGVTYFDVAPSYGDAELKLGPALEPFRNDVFLACKSTMRTKKELTGELNRSLERLRTDHFDLYQLHALTTADDIRTAFGPDGALEAVEQAKKDGKVRYTGFSAHSVEAAMEALELFRFDSILVPINFVVWYNGSFGPQLVEYARSRDAAVLAIKSMAFTGLPEGAKRPFPNCWYQPVTDEEKASLALRFTLSQPVTAAVPPGDESLFRMALKLAPSFIPLTEGEKNRLKRLAEDIEPLFSYPSGQFGVVKQKG